MCRTDYFRARFAEISTSMIEEDKAVFQGSDEERDAVKRAYLTFKGDMECIINSVVSVADVPPPR